MSKLSLLHVSDLHWAPHHKTDLQIVSDALLSDVAKYSSENEIKINAVIFSGDLALGGDEPEWFKGAYDNFLKPVADQLGLSMDKVFVAPGNHDISRELVRKIPSIHKGLLEKLTNNEAINRLIDAHHSVGSEQAQSLNRMSNFYAEHDERHPAHSGSTPFYRTGKFLHGGRLIGVACLNTAWMATGEGEDHDHQKLVMGERAVDQALGPVDKLDSQLLRDVIQDSFCGGYLGAVADGGCRVGIL